MKILFSSVFRDGTGYAHSAKRIAHSLLAAGLDVTLKSISLSGVQEDLPPELEAATHGSVNGITHYIQYYLPHMFVPKVGVKNIGMFHCETTHFKPSKWQFYANLMDVNVAACNQNKQAFEDSGIKTPIEIIPIGCDVNKYANKDLPKFLDLPSKPFIFYAIGDWSIRKNYEQLVRVYLNSFTKADNVVLVLKTYVSGMSADQSYKVISDKIAEIKSGLRRFNIGMYPEIMLICDRLSDDQIDQLHCQGDCFVSVEKGAGYGLPAFDAKMFGNKVLAPSWGGHTDFLYPNRWFQAHLVPCHGMTDTACPYRFLYTSHEEWAEISDSDLQYELMWAINSPISRVQDINNYSYLTVGNQWKEMLSQC